MTDREKSMCEALHFIQGIVMGSLSTKGLSEENCISIIKTCNMHTEYFTQAELEAWFTKEGVQ